MCNSGEPKPLECIRLTIKTTKMNESKSRGQSIPPTGKGPCKQRGLGLCIKRGPKRCPVQFFPIVSLHTERERESVCVCVFVCVCVCVYVRVKISPGDNFARGQFRQGTISPGDNFATLRVPKASMRKWY